MPPPPPPPSHHAPQNSRQPPRPSGARAPNAAIRNAGARGERQYIRRSGGGRGVLFLRRAWRRGPRQGRGRLAPGSGHPPARRVIRPRYPRPSGIGLVPCTSSSKALVCPSLRSPRPSCCWLGRPWCQWRWGRCRSRCRWQWRVRVAVHPWTRQMAPTMAPRRTTDVRTAGVKWGAMVIWLHVMTMSANASG